MTLVGSAKDLIVVLSAYKSVEICACKSQIHMSLRTTKQTK